MVTRRIRETNKYKYLSINAQLSQLFCYFQYAHARMRINRGKTQLIIVIRANYSSIVYVILPKLTVMRATRFETSKQCETKRNDYSPLAFDNVQVRYVRSIHFCV